VLLERRELLFERRHFGAENELAGFKRSRNGLVDLALDGVILRLQVGIRDHRVF
jgi:hypothetical protein